MVKGSGRFGSQINRFRQLVAKSDGKMVGKGEKFKEPTAEEKRPDSVPVKPTSMHDSLPGFRPMAASAPPDIAMLDDSALGEAGVNVSDVKLDFE